MNQTQTLSSDFLDALEQAACWRLMGVLMECPDRGWLEEVGSLAREIADPLLRQAAAAAAAASDGSYLKIFGPGGRVSPREAAYRGMRDPGSVLADLNRFYKAFAFCPRIDEPPDHIATVAGFSGFLCTKEAYAVTRENLEALAITRNARKLFSESHLEGFVDQLAQRLSALPDVPAYMIQTAAALESRVESRLPVI